MCIVQLVLVASFTVIGCADPARRTATSAQTTGASLQSRHTVDNAGFHDNAGHTSDDYPANEMSGARATEGGGLAPASSPRTTPLPEAFSQNEHALSPNAEPLPAGPTQPAGVSDDRGARLSRAICDRETFCNHVGKGREWKSQDACTTHYTMSGQKQIESASCERGIDTTQLAACLQAVRALPCNTEPRTLEAIPACRANTLCNP